MQVTDRIWFVQTSLQKELCQHDKVRLVHDALHDTLNLKIVIHKFYVKGCDASWNPEMWLQKMLLIAAGNA